MDKLWKKEGASCVFVNLCLFAGNSEKAEDGWENLSLYESCKDNQHSTELRMKGNVKFRLGLWTDAMDFSNQSLCFAEVNSENVTLAYANRSECFFRMEKYHEALIDIELAESSNISSRLMSKLDQIQQKSMASNENAKKCGKNEKSQGTEKCEIDKTNECPKVKMNFEQNRNYPCMANVLDIESNQNFGRHLIAKCDIPVGQTVLIEEDFVSMRVDDELVCGTCSKPKMNFIACANCTEAVFCNSDCMKRNLTHKWECGTIFAQLHYRMRFHIQAILLAVGTFGTVERLMEFVENVLLEDPDEVPPSLNNAQLKALFDTDEKQRFLMHLVLHHFLVIKTNSIISKNPWSTISVFNVLSMLNHSCVPNIYHPRKGNQQYCVTIRPVKKGEQLFISYLPINNELLYEERNEKFTSTWGFSCICEKCRGFKKPIEPNSIISDSNFQFIVENFNIEGNRDKLPILMENCIIFLNNFGNTPCSNEILMIVTIFVVLYIETLS
ncbi:N-lysine methyltransferase SMYD2-B-like [Sitodiplosis mosellana]|uniref:N-lysine methyltransferase SMYD2-B-like n=1 Tax=Sitodiplosis mosellana TaxID=263140 RepID=UPI002444AE8B|nr:N-lysine methyltransferase SMYD2-B-like [Sitodiplosis mosellana]